MKRLSPAAEGQTVKLELDGQPLPALEGESAAAALLAAGEQVFSRSPKYHRPRGPFCLEGACAQCLMRVDGVPNVHTCRTPARAGLRLERQNAYPTARFDLFAATDWFFPRGLNHHELFAGVPVAEKVMAKVARQLAGLGKLPDTAAPPVEPPLEFACEVAVVGAGPAGLAAAEQLSRAGVDYCLLEREQALGGRLRYGVPSPSDPRLEPPAGERVRAATPVVGCFADAQGLFLAAVQAERLLRVRARTLLFCNGGVPRLLPFDGNDLPGVFSGRAVSALVRVHRLLPGPRVACVGDAGEARALAALLEAAGAEPVAVGAEPVEAHGVNAVSAITVRQGGRTERVACDAVALCAAPGPAYELARQGGAHVSFRPQWGIFAVDADAEGKTARAEVRVAGELLGPMSADEAAGSGRRAARAIALGAP